MLSQYPAPQSSVPTLTLAPRDSGKAPCVTFPIWKVNPLWINGKSSLDTLAVLCFAHCTRGVSTPYKPRLQHMCSYTDTCHYFSSSSEITQLCISRAGSIKSSLGDAQMCRVFSSTFIPQEELVGFPGVPILGRALTVPHQRQECSP